MVQLDDLGGPEIAAREPGEVDAEHRAEGEVGHDATPTPALRHRAQLGAGRRAQPRGAHYGRHATGERGRAIAIAASGRVKSTSTSGRVSRTSVVTSS